MKEQPLTHLNKKGEAHIVDIGEKSATLRRAVASAQVIGKPDTIDAIFGGTLKKGDALAVARIAGIMAAKKTADLIPLCHPIALTKVEVDITRASNKAGTINISAIAQTTDKTGVEMEAMSAASITALTLYDMAKSIDRSMSINFVRLEEKSGGKSGIFKREEND